VIVTAGAPGAAVGPALASVFAQGRPADEVLVVASGTGPAPDLGPYAGRVRLVRAPAGGAAAARNAGIDCASGDLLAFLDAGAAWEPDKLARQVELFRRHPELGLAAGAVGGERPRRRYLDRLLPASPGRVFETSTRIGTSTVVVRREALGRHRFDRALRGAGDEDLWVRLLAAHPAFIDSRPLAAEGVPAAGDDGADLERVVHRYCGLLGPAGLATWEGRLFCRWAGRRMDAGEPQAVLGPAWARVFRQPLAPACWWVLLKCLLLIYLPPPLSRRLFPGGDGEAPQRGGARPVLGNVAWNLAGMAVPLMAGFVLAPFLIRHLGQTGYGLWILLGSFTSYFGALDLGVRSSVGRYIAFYRARDDREGVNATLSTALAILSAAGTLALLLTFAGSFLFFAVFRVPAGEVAEVRLALMLVGLNLALMLLLNVFDATLWAGQRFDLLNAVDIPVVVTRTALSFWLIGSGYGLATLATITLATTVAGGLTKAVLSFRLDPGLRFAPRLVSRGTARTLYGYGIWYFLLSVARILTPQISPLIIGAYLAVRRVTAYNVASRLVGYTTSLLLAATGVLTPLVAALDARNEERQQRRLFLKGGKYCLALALFFLALFLFLGRPFITLWVGPELAYANGFLMVLGVGEVLPLSQWVTNSLLLGKNRHRLFACASIAENALAVGLALALVGPYGVYGVCVGMAVPGALCRGLFQMVYGCRSLGVPLATYARRALLPPLVTALPPTLLLAAVTFLHEPETWAQLVLYAAGFGLLYLLCLLSLTRGTNRPARLPPAEGGKAAGADHRPGESGRKAAPAPAEVVSDVR
jgi:O-antigen/teichoic acid export membrane protein